MHIIWNVTWLNCARSIVKNVFEAYWILLKIATCSIRFCQIPLPKTKLSRSQVSGQSYTQFQKRNCDNVFGSRCVWKCCWDVNVKMFVLVCLCVCFFFFSVSELEVQKATPVDHSSSGRVSYMFINCTFRVFERRTNLFLRDRTMPRSGPATT